MRRFPLCFLHELVGTHSSRRRLISKEWHSHSEQLKMWIAATASDTKVSSTARSYIYNLDLDNVLNSFEDVVDLTLSMKKVQYPREGQTADAMQRALLRAGSSLTVHDIDNLCKLVSVHPDAAFEVLVTVLSNAVVLQRVDELCGGMSFDAILRLCECVWRPIAIYKLGEVSSFLYIAARHLALHVKDAPALTEAVLAIVQADAPMSIKELQALRNIVVESTAEMNSSDAVAIVEAIVKHPQSLDASLVAALQRNFVRVRSPPSELETARFMRALSSMGCSAGTELAKLVYLTATQCTENVLLSLSISVSHQLVTCPENQELAKIRNAIARRVGADLLKNTIFVDSKIRLVACLSEIEPISARKAFTDIMQNVKLMSSITDVASLSIIMKNTDVYPAGALERIQTAPTDDLTTPTSTYTLYVLTAAGAAPPEKLLSQCLASHGLHRFGRRFKSSTPLSGDKCDGDTVFLLLCLLHQRNSEANSTVRLLLRQWSPTRFDVHILLQRIAHIKAMEAVVAQDIVVAVSRHINALRCDEIESVLALMSKTSCRNAVVFEMALERLVRLNPPFTTILCAASCAQKLRLGPLFDRSPIIERISTLTDVSDDDMVKFLRVCPSSQRARFAQLHHIDALVENLTLSDLETPELLTLFSVVERKSARRLILNEVHTRAVPSEEELTPEDALVAIEAASHTDQVRELFRIGGPSLQRVDEGQLGRLQLKMKAMKRCPNVCFRIVGRALLHLADRLSVESALMWLSLYMTHNVRDDSVSKALIRKVNSRSSSLSPSAAKQLNEATRFFGLEQSKSPPKRSKRKNAVLTSAGDSMW